MKKYTLLTAIVIGCTFCIQKKTASVQFNKKSENFSVVKGDVHTITYEVTNTGNDSLKILSAQASCGCTHINYPKTAIAPGKKGLIDVIYDSKNEDRTAVVKTIILKTNATPILHTLTLIVNIK